MTPAERGITSCSSLLLHSGRVFTGDRLHPTATALLIIDGRISRLGTDDELLQDAEPHTQLIDVQGGLITPGFIDAHVHAVYAGVERNACNLSEATDSEDTFRRIRDYVSDTSADTRSAGDWIFGGGWYAGYFPAGTPTAQQLDTLTAGRPAYLINTDHHSAWVNSAALELAGITTDTVDPPDGIIERSASGAPTGILHEGAMDLISAVMPTRTPAEMTAGVQTAAQHLESLGVIGWQEAILGPYAGYGDASEAYRHARRSGTVPETVSGALWVPRSTTADSVDRLVDRMLARRKANAEAGLTTRTAKIMVDGVPENRTAAMLEDYCRCGTFDTQPTSAPGEDRGLAYLDREVLLAVSMALDTAGFDLHFHAIGDRAVRWALDSVDAVRAANESSDGRHHIAHIQVVHPKDIPRFASSGAAANLQALWACNDPQMQEHTTPQLGPERHSWQYPFSSIRRAGARLCMGSDWPVSTPDPWQAVHVAVNRTFPHTLDPQVAKNSPLVPGEALELSAALEAYTSGSAWQMRLEDRYGWIKPGAVASLAVAGRNPFDGDPRSICDTKNILTITAGKVTYDGR